MDTPFHTEEPDEITHSFPIVSEKTVEALKELHARALEDRNWKRDFLDWMATKGKDPIRHTGYADASVRKTHYKVEQIMRWMWDHHGYTTQITPDNADTMMKQLARYSQGSDANLQNYAQAFLRLFKYKNNTSDTDYDWSCEFQISQSGVTDRAIFRKCEMAELYETALEYGTVKHYHSCNREERDALKGTLAKRFGKEKENITKHDFKRANSFKIPSLIGAALDCGLRPIEVERSNLGWLDLDEHTLEIPAEEASKSDKSWSPTLSSKTVRALEIWLEERESIEKYDNTNAIWLNAKGNPYSTYPLNYLLDQLVEESEIEPAGRDLTFYSIRHSTATLWVEKEGVADAMSQLRHSKSETTLGYAHPEQENKVSEANSKWS